MYVVKRYSFCEPTICSKNSILIITGGRENWYNLFGKQFDNVHKKTIDILYLWLNSLLESFPKVIKPKEDVIQGTINCIII